MARLLEKYRQEIRPKLMEKFGYANVHAAPKLERIVVNMGVGKARDNPKEFEDFQRDLGTITGQKPLITRARKSIANFHLREGYPVGCCVTMRGKRMYEFLDRLVSIAIPRIRDFRWLKTKLDQRGNYSMGLQDQIVFPEVNADKVDKYQGMNITMRITGGRDDASRWLLQELGMPFKKDKE